MLNKGEEKTGGGGFVSYYLDLPSTKCEEGSLGPLSTLYLSSCLTTLGVGTRTNRFRRSGGIIESELLPRRRNFIKY